jgi:hypothetical protein
MKRSTGLITTIVALAVSASTTSAALTDYDGFDYSGTTLNGQNGGTGWSGGWIATGASPSDNLSNDATSLSYPVGWESPASTPSTTGARVSTGDLASNASSSRLLANTFDMTVDGNTMYVSALFRKNRANGETTGDNILLEFVDAGANRRFGMGIEGNTDTPWLNANGSGTAATTVTAGSTYFLVAKIVAGQGGTQGSGGLQDVATLWVFGDSYRSEVPLTEPGTFDRQLTEFTGAILDRIRIRIDTGNTGTVPGEVDEIRVGTDWQSVVAVPEPAVAGLIGLGAVAIGMRRRRQA